MAEQTKPRIRIVAQGPYIVSGNVKFMEITILSDRHGTALEYRQDRTFPRADTYRLCRCGKSAHMPYCDGAHEKSGFEGRERADRTPFTQQSDVYRGPGLILEDVESLCMLARFCHLGGDTWSLIEASDDPELRELAIRGACNCPSGRLVVRDARNGQPIEPDFEPSIAILHDSADRSAGSLWVRGGIPIESADGTLYEVRNRVTLCRCGRSSNMPYCDGTHLFGYRF